MESALLWIVSSTVRQFTVMHIVFATTVSLHDANDDQQEQQNCNGQQHADEPSGVGNVLFWNDLWTVG